MASTSCDLYLHDTCTWLSSLPLTRLELDCTSPAYLPSPSLLPPLYPRQSCARDWGCFDRKKKQRTRDQTKHLLAYGESPSPSAAPGLLLPYLITCAALLSQVRGWVRVRVRFGSVRFVLALWGISDVAVTVAKMEFRCQAIRLQLTLS